MKKITYLLLFIAITTYSQSECSNVPEYNSVEKQSQLILKYYELAIKSTDEEKIEYDKMFFCVFPNDFDTMERIFGYHPSKGNLLYSQVHKVIGYFRDLTNIDKDSFFNKYINICVDGEWEADGIGYGFGLKKHVLSNPKYICDLLSLRTDKEIKSVLRFAFDGPHPINLKKEYHEFYDLFAKYDSRIANLLKISYTKLLKDREHTH